MANSLGLVNESASLTIKPIGHKRLEKTGQETLNIDYGNHIHQKKVDHVVMNSFMRGAHYICCGQIRLGLMLLALGLILNGCSTLRLGSGSDGTAKVADLTLNVTLDKSAYRPSEAMVMTVTLTNVSSKELPVRMLDAQSVEFWFHLAGNSDTPIRREPVFSSQEPMDDMRKLAPGESVQRVFLLTRMTHFKGSMVAQAQYKPGIPYDTMQANKIYSDVATYEVHGEPLFEREDAAGLIVKDAAISLARAQCPDPGSVEDAQALLVEDEMGFYRYWVNLKVKDAQGTDKLTGYLVDPYRGVVNGQVKPFDPNAAQDPRLKRPGQLPKLGIPTQQAGGGQ